MKYIVSVCAFFALVGLVFGKPAAAPRTAQPTVTKQCVDFNKYYTCQDAKEHAGMYAVEQIMGVRPR